MSDQPHRRAVILVPGYSRRESLAARDQLVSSLQHYSDGFETSVSDPTSKESFNIVTVNARDRKTDQKIDLDVYEAYWGDLVPDWSEESPWQRFKRGSLLMWYWAPGGVVRASLKGQLPTRTTVAFCIAALMLVLWYIVIVSLFFQAVGSTDGDTETPTWVQQILTGHPWAERAVDFLRGMGDWPLIAFLVGLFGLGALERLANVSTFLKAYLRDDVMGEDTIGVRAKARKRLYHALDFVADDARKYDDIHIVAHSLGGAIAVDALAEYGEDLKRITLHTWGAPLRLMAQQEILIEREIAKLQASETRIENWIDVAFRNDVFTSVRAEPNVYVGDTRTRQAAEQIYPDTLQPRMPKRSWLAYSEHHGAYYRCDQAMVPVLTLPEALPESLQTKQA